MSVQDDLRDVQQRMGGVVARKRRPLQDVVNQLLELMAAIESQEGEVDDVQAEQLDLVGYELGTRVDAYACAYRCLNEEAAAAKEVAKYYSQRAKTREAQAKALRDRLHAFLESANLDRVKGQTATATIQASPPSLEVDEDVDLKAVNAFFVRTKVELDTRLVLETLKGGATLPWARVRQSKHLRFR